MTSETKITQIIDIGTMHPDDINDHAGCLLIDGNPPALVLERDVLVPDYALANDIGARVLSAARLDFRESKMDREQESVNLPAIDSPRHLDGVGIRPFLQIHSNLGPTLSEVLFYVQPLDHRQQVDLVSAAKNSPSRDSRTNFDTMPNSVRHSPVVAIYRARLEAGQTVVFKNGFNLSNDGITTELITHKFHSVDTEGNRIEAPRKIAVGSIFFANKISRGKGGVLNFRNR